MNKAAVLIEVKIQDEIFIVDINSRKKDNMVVYVDGSPIMFGKVVKRIPATSMT